MPECAFYNAEELAQLLGLKKTTVHTRLCVDPERLPPSVKIGRGRVFKKDTVHQWLDDLPEGYLR